VSGALAERVFAHKITKVGFTDLVVHERRSFSIDDASRYPLFTDDLLELMRELLPPSSTTTSPPA
jgi:arsenite methyltransferase